MNEIFEWVLGLNMLKETNTCYRKQSNDWTNNWLNSLNDFRVLICLKEKNELVVGIYEGCSISFAIRI